MIDSLWHCSRSEVISWVGRSVFVAQDGFEFTQQKEHGPIIPRAALDVVWDAFRSHLGELRLELEIRSLRTDVNVWTGFHQLTNTLAALLKPVFVGLCVITGLWLIPLLESGTTLFKNHFTTHYVLSEWLSGIKTTSEKHSTDFETLKVLVLPCRQLPLVCIHFGGV